VGHSSLPDGRQESAVIRHPILRIRMERVTDPHREVYITPLSSCNKHILELEEYLTTGFANSVRLFKIIQVVI